MGMFVKKPTNNNKESHVDVVVERISSKTSNEVVEDIDISKIDFSFLNDDVKLDWVDTSLKKHNERRIKAYDNYAY